MNNIIKQEETQNDLKTLKELVTIAYDSGNYSGMSKTTLLNMALSARDLGISPYKAFNGGFYIVNGKISMSTSLMVDRIRKEGHSIKIPEMTSKKCVIRGIRKDNRDSVKLEFTWEDAVAAGLTSSPTWKKYPKAMLYNRAMSMLARILFPDVVGNCYSEDEGEEIARKSTRGKNVTKAAEEEPSIEVDADVDALVAYITQSVELDKPEFLKEYVAYCSARVERPIGIVINSWVSNPQPFKDHYAKWVLKKEVENNPDENVNVG